MLEVGKENATDVAVGGVDEADKSGESSAYFMGSTPEEASPLFSFTLLTVEDPQPYGKVFSVGQDGALARQTQGAHVRGTLKRAQTDMDGLMAILRAATPGQHIVSGLPDIEQGIDVPFAAASQARDGELTRTDACLRHLPGPGVMLVDSDGIGDPDLVLEHLADACPAIADCASALKSSTGANVFNGEQELTGATGLHALIPVLDASDLPRAMDVLFNRLWLAGRGWIKVSETGQMMPRTVLDRALMSPSQPMFLRAATMLPLEQKPKRWRTHGHALDTRTALPDLTDQERERVAELQAQARALKAQEAAGQKGRWIESRVASMVARGVNADTAREQAHHALENADLYADWELTLADGSRVTVAQVLADRKRYHGTPCRDPLEPDYGSNTVAKIYCDQAKPVLRSFAHGERTYFMHPVTQAQIDAVSASMRAMMGRAAAPASESIDHETGEIVPAGSVSSGAALVVVRGDTVKVEDIDWAWKGFFAHGSLHLTAGRPEAGKTTTAISLGATWSSAGKWPDGTACEGGHVVMWTGEDQIASVVTPRFIAAGADMTQVHFITARKNPDGTTAPFDPAKDMHMIGPVINDLGGHVFLILDPIISAVAGNSDKANEVRRSLQPLVDLLAQTRSVGVGITHVNKASSGRNLLERILGSGAFAALARLAFMSASDAESGQRILVRAKSNIGPSGGGFPYRIIPKPVDGMKEPVPTVEWGEYTPGDPLTLLADIEGPDNAEERSTLQDCCDFVMEVLSANGATRATEVEKAVTAAKFSKSSLRKARERLQQAGKIHTERSGFGGSGGWIWKLGPAPKMTVRPSKGSSM